MGVLKRRRALRLATVVLVLAIATLLLFGCTPSIKGQWVRSDGTVLTFDDEWVTGLGTDDVRYRVDGKTSISLTSGNATRQVRWSIKGDILSFDGAELYRAGSGQAAASAAVLVKTQAEERAVAVCSDRRKELDSKYWSGGVMPDCPSGGGMYAISSRFLGSPTDADFKVEQTVTCPKHGSTTNTVAYSYN